MRIELEGGTEETIYFRVKKAGREIHLVGRREHDQPDYGFIVAVVTEDLKVSIHPIGAKSLGIEVK